MNAPQGSSFGAQFLLYGGGLTGIYGLLSAYSTISDTKFAFGGADGVPLPSSWPGVIMLLVSAAVIYWLGTRWDRPRFAAVRRRHRWLVPAVITFVVLPGLVAVLFVMLR